MFILPQDKIIYVIMMVKLSHVISWSQVHINIRKVTSTQKVSAVTTTEILIRLVRLTMFNVRIQNNISKLPKIKFID